MKKALLLLACIAGVANAQLQARDVDGNGSVDAYYDVQQNISWLADANLYVTQGGQPILSPWSSPYDPTYLAPGQLRIRNAVTWLGSLVVGGIDGWRLPSRLVPSGSTADTSHCSPTECYDYMVWGNELSTMLSNQLNGLSSFANVANGGYLTATGTVPHYVEVVNPTDNHIFGTDETSLVYGYVWAVHDGDVGNIPTGAVSPVPEPQTYALMLAGLLATGVALRKRQTLGST